MDAITLEAGKALVELRARRELNNWTSEEVLRRDPAFAKRLYVLTGFTEDNCPVT